MLLAEMMDAARYRCRYTDNDRSAPTEKLVGSIILPHVLLTGYQDGAQPRRGVYNRAQRNKPRVSESICRGEWGKTVRWVKTDYVHFAPIALYERQVIAGRMGELLPIVE